MNRLLLLICVVLSGCAVSPRVRAISSREVDLPPGTTSISLDDGSRIAVEGVPRDKPMTLRRTQFIDESGRIGEDWDLP